MQEKDLTNKGNGEKLFPRELTKKEKELLFTLLPDNKPGYKLYKNKIEKLKVVGKGRFGGRNLILGKSESEPDLSIPLMPVFAAGTVICKECEINVIIHEEIDDEIEIDISPKTMNQFPETISIKDNWSYSDWTPGDKAPNDNLPVREIELLRNKYFIVIAPSHKKMWVHNVDNGVNVLIPVGKYYNNLMLIKNIRESKIVLNPNLLFKDLNDYSDSDLASAFLLYNKYVKRIDIDYSYFENQKQNKEKKSLFNFLHRG